MLNESPIYNWNPLKSRIRKQKKYFHILGDLNLPFFSILELRGGGADEPKQRVDGEKFCMCEELSCGYGGLKCNWKRVIRP